MKTHGVAGIQVTGTLRIPIGMPLACNQLFFGKGGGGKPLAAPLRNGAGTLQAPGAIPYRACLRVFDSDDKFVRTLGAAMARR